MMPVVLCVTLLIACTALALSERRQAMREEAWAKERASLLQRIQAPEIAVYENAREDRSPPPRIGFEDDAAFAAARVKRD